MVSQIIEERTQKKIAHETGATFNLVRNHWNTIKHYSREGQINYMKGLVNRQENARRKKAKPNNLPKNYQRQIDEVLDENFQYNLGKLKETIKNQSAMDRISDLKPMLWAMKTIGDPERARRAFNAVFEAAFEE